MTTSINVLGFDVSTLDAKTIVSNALSDNNDKHLVINTINPHSYVEQKTDPEFNIALKSSDFLIPDGSGIVLAANVIHGRLLNKVAGFDLFGVTMTQLNAKSGKVFFLGSAETVLEKIIKRAKNEYPNVCIETLSPPFKASFDESDLLSFVDAINSFSPDVVFVGLTAPKQEKLIQTIRGKISPKFSSGIGAVFDFYAGTVKRPSEFWVKFHMEWLVRLVGEPKRLWRRNFVSTPIFLKDVLVEKFKVAN